MDSEAEGHPKYAMKEQTGRGGVNPVILNVGASRGVGHAVAQLVEALRYKPGSIPDGATGIFH